MKNWRYKFILITTVSLLALGCKKESPESCSQPASQQLLIQLKDSTGNFIEFPNQYFILSDSIDSFYMGTMILSPDQSPRKVLDVNIDKMISGYPYLIEFDSLTVDTLSVYWSMINTSCGNNQYFHREVDSFIYNNATIYGGYVRTVIK